MMDGSGIGTDDPSGPIADAPDVQLPVFEYSYEDALRDLEKARRLIKNCIGMAIPETAICNAFRAERNEALEAAAAVADATESYLGPHGRDIAAAIRALKTGAA
jgi:hypothetical protein